MAQTINNQVISMTVQKYLNSTYTESIKASNRLSSGQRVNSAQDDASGLAIAERMNALVRGLQTSIRNANDGISMAQTAEGGLSQVNDALQRMRELALQSANGTYSNQDRQNLNQEYTALNEEIARLSSSTTFNGQSLLDNASGSVDFQVGPGTGPEDVVSVDTTEVNAVSTDISTVSDALASVDEIDALLAEVGNSRAYYGAVQNRFDSVITNLQNNVQNQAAARGRIMDADYALETARLTRSQILNDVGLAMSSQANISANSVAQLLG